MKLNDKVFFKFFDDIKHGYIVKIDENIIYVKANLIGKNSIYTLITDSLI